jgi:hypothetical protein
MSGTTTANGDFLFVYDYMIQRFTIIVKHISKIK